MKKVGDKVRPRYKGKVITEFEVKKIAKLPKPEVYYNRVIGGQVSFNPTIILLEASDDGHKEIWLPYWITTPATKGKERYGQFAPKYLEHIFLRLMKTAIKEGLFTKGFLRQLYRELDKTLSI